MQWGSVVRAWGASRRCLFRPIGVLAVATLAASAAGCSSMPSAGRLTLASAGPSGNATVAFESIDGPPPEVFRKLVADLNEEAGARKVAVVSRSGAATYRIRGYVSAVVERGKTTYAWVWDVYDTDKRRMLRISGEEAAAPGKRRDAWIGADEQVIRRMARNGMDQIAGFLNSSEPAPPVVPEQALVTLASARDDSPESAGIFRVSRTPEQPDSTPTPETADVQAPAPKAKKRSVTATDVSRSTDGRATSR